MIRLLVASIAMAAGAAAAAAPLRYEPPPETVSLGSGEDVELVEAICASCHSLDYITTQPRMGQSAGAFWAAEVRKMQTAYGSDISSEDAAKIVAYLTETYR